MGERTYVCLDCGDLFDAEEIDEKYDYDDEIEKKCENCGGKLMDWSDWMEMKGNPYHWPKCPVCGSFYLTKNPCNGNPYAHYSFQCDNCDYLF